MKAHIWINTGSLRLYNFNMINVLEDISENRLLSIKRDGTSQMLDQSAGLYPQKLIVLIMGEEIDSIDTIAENRYFVNELKEHLTYKFTVPIRIFLSTETHEDQGLSHKAYDCFVGLGGFDPAAASIAHELSANPSFAPIVQGNSQTFTFEFWIQRDGYWVNYDMYEEEPEPEEFNIIWRARPGD